VAGISSANTSCIVRRLDGGRDLLELHEQSRERYPFLLESVAHGTPQARFDILFAHPQDHRQTEPGGSPFLPAVDAWWQGERQAQDPSLAGLPFRGGWFLYLGYELAGEIESGLRLPAAPAALPTALAVRCPAALIRDHEQNCLFVVAEREYGHLLDSMLADAAAPASTVVDEPLALEAVREDPPQRYLDGVRRIKNYIVEGDVFQVNLSRAWNVELRLPSTAAALYRHLRRRNPAPFAGLACWNGAAVISSSPERLVRARGDHVDTRPIAGTRPRGDDDTADAQFSRELLGHPKERAEHIMLIDLERNDLGRICAPGSIHVDELMVLESYAHVHHIVSNVDGRLRNDVTPGEVIAAVFPGGTITGCPKVRCMEIIAELEQEGRGAYTGAMGYLNRDGDMDLNILIRTIVQQDKQLTLRAGAGIVADSVPEQELAETRAKARGLLLALGWDDWADGKL